MHSVLNDALDDPLGVIKVVAERNKLAYASSHFPTEIAAYFQDIFEGNERLKQITSLDPSHPLECHSNCASRTLVRFRAMVQDTSLSPELYPSVLSDGSPGAWGLAEAVDLFNSSMPDLQSLRQREVIWAVTVPGESPFVSELLDNAASTKVITPKAPRSNNLLNNRYKDPLLRTSHVGLQVKIYDTSIMPLKPTDICTFVGFLSRQHTTLDESLSGAGSEPDSESYALHVVFAISHSCGYFSKSLELNNSLFNNHTVRNELIDWIAVEGLKGDRDAAVWVLLTCISRVFSRQPPIMPLSLTISKCPISGDAITREVSLANVLRLILPSFLDISLSLSFINSRPFSPESQDDNLHSGLLQLPTGTTILFSEFEVQEGTINDCGVQNIQALKELVESQTLNYKFPFVPPYSFPTDLPIIVLTSADSSLFVPTHVNVPLECEETALDGGRSRCTPPGKLAAFRALLRDAKLKDAHFAEDVSEYIQSDFVLERQRAPETTPDDLIYWLNISRLLALSYNQTYVTIDIWSETKELEKRRKSRLNNR